MTGPMRRIGEFLLAWRTVIAISAAAALVASAFALPHTRFNMSLTPLLQADDELVESWGLDASELDDDSDLGGAALALDWGRQVSLSDLEFLDDFAAQGIQIVRDLRKLMVVDHDGAIPLPRPVEQAIGERSFGEFARRHPLLDGSLVSRDGEALLIFVLEPEPELARELLEAAIPEHVDWRFISAWAANDARRDYMVDDILRTLTIEFVLFSILLPLLFGSLRSVVIPLGVVLIATVLSFGSLTMFGQWFSIIDCAVPGLIVVIGLSDAVHMMHRFEEALARGLEKHAAIVEMVSNVGWACVLTSVTTAIGFLSLIVADHAAVREFGFKSAYAVLLTLLTTLTLIPIAMSIWPVRNAAPPRIPGIGSFDYRFPRVVLACTAITIALAAVGASKNYVDAQWLEELPENDRIVQDLTWFDREFNGFSRVEFVARGDFRDPATVRALEALGDDIVASEPDVRACETYVDWLRELLGRPDGELDDHAIEGAVQLLELSGDRFPSHRIDPDLKLTRLVLSTSNLGMHRYFELGDLVTERARSIAPGLEPELGGKIRIAHESVRLIATTMLESFAISLLAITILVSSIYRSIRIGLISIVPNALPVFVALGLTGWLDIPIRIGLVMLYSLGLGLAVDDSIHVLTRYEQERRHGTSRQTALLATLRSSGGALLITSLVLGLGAICHLPSDLRSLQDVGVILGAVVVTALIADLYLLPLLLEWFGPPEHAAAEQEITTNSDARPRRTPEAP